MGTKQPITIFLCGDVMTGRGIDQILPQPADPTLYESFVRDARVYVQLAEQRTGPMKAPVDFEYIWGDALEMLRKSQLPIRPRLTSCSALVFAVWDLVAARSHLDPDTDR